ncbi:hypothetical protein C8Q80DRAFT_1105775 [Daedaleopsis nitida]|nr:hypothetical protein C8Q80DRAFT_1105775 [Daedaleopsis nitida]
MLTEPLSHAIVIFTADLGPVPGESTSLYCRKCNTRYYHNYFVHNRATTRTYYMQPPPFLEIAQHFYITSSICENFANSMMLSWTSATNCAEIYNLAERPHDLSVQLSKLWKLKPELTTELVWDAFYIHALLLDHQEREFPLELVHNAPSHFERLRPALQARNIRMVGPGQEEWSHACKLCCWIYDDEESGEEVAIRSVVTDGVTVGHPCCAVHDCKLPLVRRKGARYCIEHAAKELECSIIGCSAPAEHKFKSCTDPAHRALDERYHMQNAAMFQLKGRYERLNESRGRGSDHSLADTDTQHTCTEKSPHGNRRLKTQFGRKRTHNEELCVASCGTILGRASFHGSEAINGVVQFWRRLFPYRQSLPQILWHDQNCRVWAMIHGADSDDDTREFFSHCALPVDVFHFKCKHKETDTICGTHCNPYNWPELRTPDGKWRFNSSAAEQINAWFCKFHPMVREMDVDRFNFFLDEMVKRRNRLTVHKLKSKGQTPYRIPRDALLHQQKFTKSPYI